MQAWQEQQVRRSRHKGSRVIGYQLSHAFVSISRGGFARSAVNYRHREVRDLQLRSDCYSELLNRKFIVRPEYAMHVWAKPPSHERERRIAEGWHPSGYQIAGGKSSLPSHPGSNRFDRLAPKPVVLNS